MPITLKPDLLPVINFALTQNRVPFLRRLGITSTEPRSHLRLGITCEPAFFEPLEIWLDELPENREFRLTEFDFHLNTELLAGLTERLRGRIFFTLTDEAGAELAAESAELDALAFDEWHGSDTLPELLAAFVTPNHPAIPPILARASSLLELWSKDGSFDAYQTKNPNRVLVQAAAIYGALQEQNIVYVVSPASFEAVGQRIRLSDTVLSTKMGNCLDLSVLFASCLEAVGLRPLICLFETHAFCGVWLEELSFPDPVSADPALITKRLADGVSEIAVFECTSLVAGSDVSFDAARRSAENRLAGEGFDMTLDIHRARLGHIRPLPHRIQTGEGWHIEIEKRAEDRITGAPDRLKERVEVREGEISPLSRLELWERKLLDLGLRNTLINLRLTKNIVPILAASLDELEDSLSKGGDYGIAPCPAGMEFPTGPQLFESCSHLGHKADLIRSEFQNKRLRSTLEEAALNRAVIECYRAAKASIEENGANTLYLAFGLLRWYETRASQRPRYAPLVLVPVDIVRRSALKGYVIRLRDEEPQMNITLLEMLRQDFGISIGGLTEDGKDTLIRDGNGLDLRTIFTTVRRAVMEQPRWDVLESAYLGIFSFSQFVMWNDLTNRLEDIRQNKIVASLLEGRLTWETGEMEMPKRISEDGVLLPMAADASQLYAIREAGQGRSFVLHGPPGTGKSQTITVLIANALAQGKTILFVAEKLAALQVVEKRLDKLGLGAYCLELHSNKSKKRDVLDQLKAASEAAASASDGRHEKRAVQLAARRKELDEYADALHKIQPCGRTLYSLIGDYLALPAGSRIVKFPDSFALSCDEDRLAGLDSVMGSLMAAGRAVRHPAGHSLTPITRTDWSSRLREEAPAAAEACLAALREFESAAEAFLSQAGESRPADREGWQRICDAADLLPFWQSVPAAWARESDFESLSARLRALCAHAEEAGVLRGELNVVFHPGVTSLDPDALMASWNEAAGQWFAARILTQNRIRKTLASYAKGPIENEAVPILLDKLCRYRTESTDMRLRLESLIGSLGHLYDEKATDWCRIRTLSEAASENSRRLLALGSDSIRTRGVTSALSDAAGALADSWQKLTGALDTATDLLALELVSDGDWLASSIRQMEDILAHIGSLKEWILWRRTAAEAIEAGFTPFVIECQLSGDPLPIEDWAVIARRSVLTTLIHHAIDNDPALYTFSGQLFDEKIARFAALDKELLTLAAEEVIARIGSKVPNLTREASQSSEVGILQRAIRSGGRGLSIRRLFEQIPNLLPRLAPCMLMSPLSAAQYLDPKRPPFDLVVFDEASQLPTCKAVGAIARGREAVIVGDPRQMPPTTFFMGSSSDEENPQGDDLESILDDCLALGMPETHLTWHYRSRHESLIAFSNHRFYENKLYTFPSVNDREQKVRLVPVDGRFDRGGSRTNPAEADAIVAELSRRAHTKALRSESVGVVTFNISQQMLIEDKLEAACARDSVLEAWAYGSEEPVFIKNLENVQGDERDVILFSIAFAPDEGGRMPMNFGPLNREGGWRRLNVAVTRARREMIVFAALRPEQIDLSRTASEGVAALKDFLAYAAGSPLAVNASSMVRSDPAGLAEAIAAALRANGWEARTGIGHSAYKIDVAVSDKQDENRYLLGILCDGPSYAGARTTRDRELAQISVLEGLGWTIHRVWSPDWWENPGRETERILEALKEACERRAAERADAAAADEPFIPDESHPEPSADASAADSPIVGAEESAPEKEPAAMPVYTVWAFDTEPMSSEVFLDDGSEFEIRRAIRAILSAEAPITESLLERRVLQAFSLTRAGTRVREKLAQILTDPEFAVSDCRGTRLFWADGQDPLLYASFRTAGEGEARREASHLPLPEIAAAALAVLREQIGLPFEDLVREAGELMGYARLGNALLSVLCEGVEYAIDAGIVRCDASGYCTLG